VITTVTISVLLNPNLYSKVLVIRPPSRQHVVLIATRSESMGPTIGVLYCGSVLLSSGLNIGTTLYYAVI